MRVYSDGNCTWWPPGRFSTPCPIDISTFPFDDQTCSLTFQSWMYGGFQLNLTLAFDMVDIGIMNGEWNFIGKRTFCRSILFSFLTMYRLTALQSLRKFRALLVVHFAPQKPKSIVKAANENLPTKINQTKFVILRKHG